MAKSTGCRLIYKYANDFGDKVEFTDYMAIMAPGDAQDQGLIDSPFVHNFNPGLPGWGDARRESLGANKGRIFSKINQRS